MESLHVVRRRPVWTIYLHLAMQTVVQHETMYHCETVRFHRMPWPIVKITDVCIVEIRYAASSHLSRFETHNTSIVVSFYHQLHPKTYSFNINMAESISAIATSRLVSAAPPNMPKADASCQILVSASILTPLCLRLKFYKCRPYP